jgi:hypothetical protein
VEGAALSARTAYKFLRPGAVGPFSGYRWPVPTGSGPGEWVAADLGAGACRAGVHASEPRHLARWVWEELWEVELGGEVEDRGHKLRAPRGRLLRRVDAWSPATARDFALACAGRAAEHAAAAERAVAAVAAGMAGDGAAQAEAARTSDDAYFSARSAAVCAYVAAMTALRVGGHERHDAEREWQASWLVDTLGLLG